MQATRSVWLGSGAFALVVACSCDAVAQRAADKSSAADATARIDLAIGEAWRAATPAWRARLAQDDMQRVCSQYRNKPPKRVAAALQAQARKTIVYPADGVIGDWRRGEAIAQSGYGLRFTDKDASRPNGGNCYACHQIDKAEVSYGTVGPSLLAYGRLNDYAEAAARKAYDKIYNSHVTSPCSAMPRFGAAKLLTTEQIRDLVALLMARDSPVNK